MPKTDLVGKLSRLAASGKHRQNAERDLQRAIKKFGRSAGVEVNYAKVRLLDPVSSQTYNASLPVLDPVSLATAIWSEGQEIFAELFLGCMGHEGAKEFWQNARSNCSWFQASRIPEEAKGGLLPISLYGDDVEAYHSAEAGAVSAIGWSCDFSYKDSAMLQMWLVTVYAEYCASVHTHNDLLEHLLPRLQHLCDPFAPHPWHAAGFRFILTGVRGDLKWLSATRSIYHGTYVRMYVCMYVCMYACVCVYIYIYL